MPANTTRPFDHHLGNPTGPVTRTFHGWSFRKIHEPGDTASWSQCHRALLPFSNDELSRIVRRSTGVVGGSKKRARAGGVSEQYNALRSAYQRNQVDRLLEWVRGEERNQNAEWSLACIEQDVQEFIRRGFGKVREVVEMRVILRRSPRKERISKMDGVALVDHGGIRPGKSKREEEGDHFHVLFEDDNSESDLIDDSVDATFGKPPTASSMKIIRSMNRQDTPSTQIKEDTNSRHGQASSSPPPIRHDTPKSAPEIAFSDDPDNSDSSLDPVDVPFNKTLNPGKLKVTSPGSPKDGFRREVRREEH